MRSSTATTYACHGWRHLDASHSHVAYSQGQWIYSNKKAMMPHAHERWCALKRPALRVSASVIRHTQASRFFFGGGGGVVMAEAEARRVVFKDLQKDYEDAYGMYQAGEGLAEGPLSQL